MRRNNGFSLTSCNIQVHAGYLSEFITWCPTTSQMVLKYNFYEGLELDYLSNKILTKSNYS